MPLCSCDKPQPRVFVLGEGESCENCGLFIDSASPFELALPPPPVVSRTSSVDDATPPFGTRHLDPLTVATASMLRHLLAKSPDRLDPETPERLARALTELVAGYAFNDESVKRMLKCFPVGKTHDGIVVVRDIPFASVCEHHVLPFTGTVAVAYLPSDRIVGLSKIPRLVRAVSRRLQVQERIGVQVADALMDHVGARGSMVVIRARHSCMTIRGAESPGETVTSTVRGVFKDNAAARHEVLEMMR